MNIQVIPSRTRPQTRSKIYHLYITRSCYQKRRHNAFDLRSTPHIRHAALRAVADAQEELASITNELMPQGVDATFLDELSCALLTVVRPNQDQIAQHNGMYITFRDTCYSRLIFALAQNDEWRERRARSGHFEHCVSLAEDALERGTWVPGCYLAGIFAYIDPSDKVLPLSPMQERWRAFIKGKWKSARRIKYIGDYISTFPALVAVTKLDLLSWDFSVPNEKLTKLTKDVHGTLESLSILSLEDQPFFIDRDPDQAIVRTALSSVQGLHDDLRRMTENSNTSQRDNGLLES
ncbi:hypothetical protein EDD22DRAFT_961127 [Suillus occidentalis]|nr:hypothetical protein EDD22DRAFT_961127 [Suillus occidentalis]